MKAPPPNADDRESRDVGPTRVPALDLRSILAPVDFSPASRHGLMFAGAVARRFGSRLHLLHVVEPPVLPQWGYAHIPQREAALRRSAVEQLPSLPGECGLDAGLVQSVQVRSGEAGDEICQAAAERQCDLVVLARHGLGGWRHAFSGSTAADVVRRAPCPVLTVRGRDSGKQDAEAPAFDLRRIVVTTDFSEASRKAFPYATALARKFQAGLILLYVVPAHLPAEVSHIGFVLEEKRLLAEARERLPAFRRAQFDPRLPVDALVASGGPAHEICRAAEKEAADLIVMATHGHTGLKHFLLGSVAENVVRHAPCPVLVVREREHEFVKP
jgi:nucleotide-binding universal stress UspA family protein